jgi:hypothetical protein
MAMVVYYDVELMEMREYIIIPGPVRELHVIVDGLIERKEVRCGR